MKNSNSPLSKKSKVDATIAERGKVYGDPKRSHTNIGLSWTALIQQTYDIVLPRPIPPSLVARMLMAMKNQRMSQAFHEDNFIDAEAYLRFAFDFQKEGK